MTELQFKPIEKRVFNAEEAMQYLSITTKSTLETLIRLRRLTPLRITRENLYARAELDDFIKREMAEARRLKEASDHASEGQD